jgi:hypothetical protein
MPDRSDALVLTLRYAGGRGQRLIIEPGSEDPRAAYTLDEAVLTKGGAWDPAGSEAVADVSIENPGLVADAPDALRDRLDEAYRTAEATATREALREALQLVGAVEAGL